jgi:L-2,4-diaminobutyric acid acetyltransferase
LSTPNSPDLANLTFRTPVVADGVGLWRLVRESGGLDENSCYAYLLIGRDFATTSVVAEVGGTLAGFVTAYLRLELRDTLFVWQVGVAAEFRRGGLGRRMLHHLLARPVCGDVRFLEATVTESNAASRRLFESLAERLAAPLCYGPGFTAEDFGGAHEAEPLVRIGPFSATSRSESFLVVEP